jgi:hypothetical protein
MTTTELFVGAAEHGKHFSYGVDFALADHRPGASGMFTAISDLLPRL